MGEEDKREYCEHLKPKEIFIENRGKKLWGDNEVPWHTCRLKQIMGLKNTHCAFSSYTNDHGEEYVQYDTMQAKGCPLYTENTNVAERVRLLMVNANSTRSSFFV